jgi:hypothetical protein
MFFYLKTRGHFSVISAKGENPEMRDDWEMSSSFRKHRKLFYRYASMFIKDLVMWRHYNVILENSDITKGHWQQLAINDNWNHLSAYVIVNIMALNIKGKVNKIVIKALTSYLYGYIRMIRDHIVICCCHLSTYRNKCVIYCNILWYNAYLIYL